MFTLHDDRGTDPTRIRTIARIDEGFALFDYVSELISYPERQPALEHNPPLGQIPPH